jgi:hypothetical protein
MSVNAPSDGAASPISVSLAKPIQAHGEEISTITMREPVPADLMELGSPMLMIPGSDGGVGLDIRHSVVARYISRLGSIPLSSVKEMSISDFMACSGAILPFLQGAAT